MAGCDRWLIDNLEGSKYRIPTLMTAPVSEGEMIDWCMGRWVDELTGLLDGHVGGQEMDAKESNRDWGGFSLLEFCLGDVPQYRCDLGKPSTCSYTQILILLS